MRSSIAFVIPVLFFASVAAAQPEVFPGGPPSPAPAPAPAPAPTPAPVQPASTETTAAPGDEAKAAPAAHTGFQMAVRTGLAIPFGTLAGSSTGGTSTSMNDVFSVQVPFLLDIGGKPIPQLFLGAYLGFGLGGAAGQLADACSQANASCVAASVRIGLEVQYHILPDQKLNPWIGYGIGIAGDGVSGSSNGQSITQSVTGPEYAHFMGGLDFRLSHTIGIGPMVDFSLGKYTHAKVEGGGVSAEGDIQNTALHEWLMIGARLVIFP